MKTYCTIWFLLFGAFTVNAQKVYKTSFKSEADKIIFVTEFKSEADMIVFDTKFKSEAKPYSGMWFWTNFKSEADWKVYFTKFKSEATLKVYFTKFKSEAGVRRQNNVDFCSSSSLFDNFFVSIIINLKSYVFVLKPDIAQMF